MENETLAEIVSRLKPEEQAAVRKFIEFMADPERQSKDTPILRAAEEFMAEHPELLRLLAQ
jgi:ABC-type glycerol-3-phosphate transport system substrate-binding protein